MDKLIRGTGCVFSNLIKILYSLSKDTVAFISFHDLVLMMGELDKRGLQSGLCLGPGKPCSLKHRFII